MFICDVSGRVSKPGENCNRIIVEVRKRVYLNDEGNVVGRGFEIVKEIKATDAAAAAWRLQHPEPLVVEE